MTVSEPYKFFFGVILYNTNKKSSPTSDFLEYLLQTAGVPMPVLLLQSRGWIESSSGDVGAAAPTVVATQTAAAAAAAGGRGRRPSPGTRLRPVCFHDLVLWFKTRVIPAPRLSRRWGRGAYDSTETQVLMLDVLHLYPFT